MKFILIRALLPILAAVGGLAGGAPGRAADDSWTIDPDARIELQALSAQTTTRDDDLVVDGEAFSLRGQLGLALERDDTRIRFEADRIEVFRIGEGRRDFSRDRFSASIEHDLTPTLEVQLLARRFDDQVSVEAADTDAWEGALRVSFEPNQDHRLRLQGTWRDRQYDHGDDPATRGEGERVDAQYRRRFGPYHYLAFDLRAEAIRSDDPERGYERESAGVAYTRPLARDLRLRPAIEVIRTRFAQRTTDQGDLRRDTQVVPEVELLWWPGKWRIEAEAKYIFFSSNDPLRDREGYRLTLSAAYVF